MCFQFRLLLHLFLIEFYLFFHCLDAVIYDFITWALKIRWSLVVSVSQCFNGLKEQRRPLSESQKIESDKVIEMSPKNFIRGQINSVIKFRKL